MRQRQALNDLAGAEAAVADPQVRQTPDALGVGVKRPRIRSGAKSAQFTAVHLTGVVWPVDCEVYDASIVPD